MGGRPAFEIVQDGLTYDLYILPRTAGYVRAEHMPPLHHLCRERHRRAFIVVEPGPHVTTALAMLPVVRTQWQVAEQLCGMTDTVAAVGWGPSEVELPTAVFQAVAKGWVADGIFPPQGLIAINSALGGALQSCGLAHFTGQELRLEAELASDEAHATRLGLRIAETLIHRGPLTEVEQLADPGGGAIRLEPSVNGKFVRVWRG